MGMTLILHLIFYSTYAIYVGNIIGSERAVKY